MPSQRGLSGAALQVRTPVNVTTVLYCWNSGRTQLREENTPRDLSCITRNGQMSNVIGQ